jgi:hypothetical protein
MDAGSFDPLPSREEALPPRANPAPGDARRLRARAIAALAVIAAAVVALQPISDALAPPALAKLLGATSASAQWARYLSRPVPDVLIIGDSRAREDVDEAAVSAALSTAEGRPTTVAKFGVNAEQPAFLDALAFRVLNRPTRPRLLVLQLSEYQFNAGYTYDSTEDLWQISRPFDTAFISYALEAATDPGRLLRGWLLPVFANYPVIARAIRCGSDPLRDAATCNQLPSTDAERATYFRSRFHDVMADYHFSTIQAGHAEAAARLARARGVGFGFVVLPVLDVPDWEPDGYARFEAGVKALADRVPAKVVDLHGQLQDRPDLWSDPNHLSLAGAHALAPLLGIGLAGELSG